MSDDAGQPRVFVHVGAPKTGTTYIQTVLYHHRDRLPEHGILYPVEHYDDHFYAAVDLQDLDFSGERRPEAEGRWEAVAAQVRAWPGTSVISHDVLAGATPEQVQHAIESLAPATVHVVCTARDLARALPSHWQEDVKHGQTATFDAWYEAVMRRDEGHWQHRWFWRAEDIPDILRRWGATLPPEHVHVITVPRPGAPPRTLWHRFADVVGIRSDDLDLDVPQANSGLGRVEVELLRQVNAAHAAALSPRRYEREVKGVLGHEVLAAASRTRRLELPAALLPEVSALAGRWREQLESAGYDVVGDLDELAPDPAMVSPAEVAPVTADAVNEVAVTALFMLLDRLAHSRREADSAVHERDRLRRELDEARAVIDEHRGLPPAERVKRTVVEIGRDSRPVGAALRGYRRLRRRG